MTVGGHFVSGMSLVEVAKGVPVGMKGVPRPGSSVYGLQRRAAWKAGRDAARQNARSQRAQFKADVAYGSELRDGARSMASRPTPVDMPALHRAQANVYRRSRVEGRSAVDAAEHLTWISAMKRAARESGW